MGAYSKKISEFGRFYDGVRMPSDGDTSQGAGPVKVYKLSPEEIERRYGPPQKLKKRGVGA